MAVGVLEGVREVEGGDMTLQSLQTAIVADCSPDSVARDRFIMHYVFCYSPGHLLASVWFDIGLWMG